MKSHLERVTFIQQAVKAKEKSSQDVRTLTINNWRGGPLTLRVITIDLDYVMYRLENSRTLRQQLRYLRNHPEISRDVFSDPETLESQNTQECILKEMIKASGEEFVEDLRLRGQVEPAIISYDGFLINGNRRAVGLRLIGKRYIDCVVLPEDATKKEYYELEQNLQLSKDFKEDYHWINELENIRLGYIEWGYSVDDLANSLRYRPNVIRSKIRMLDLVDKYLYWINKPGEYDYEELDQAEEIFRQLEIATRNAKFADDPFLSEQLQKAIFLVVEKEPTAGRKYAQVKKIIKYFDQIYSQLLEKNLGNTTEQKRETTLPQKNLLDKLIDEEKDRKEVFGDYEGALLVSDILNDTIDDIVAGNKEQEDAEMVYEAVSSALRELQGLIVDERTAKLESIKNKLEQIIIVSNELILQLKKFDKAL